MIERAAVIGAGVMGSGIAAHLANAGLPVVLLDVVPETGGERSALARAAVERALRQQPPPFMTRGAADLVTPGNLVDDLDLLRECDWIIEAIVEDAAAKHAVYALLDSHRKPGSVVSSNTSTIPLRELLAGAPAALAPDFLVTHFFNPPRYLRLLEVVAGEKTRPDAVAAVSDFADRELGKSVVPCHDTPGFIANRLGCAWLGWALAEAVARGLSVEEADAIVSAAFGCPKTGVFGLLDLVGIDLVLVVERSFRDRLGSADPFLGIEWPRRQLEAMVADGRTGRKGDGGFYRLAVVDGRRTKLALDLTLGHVPPGGEAAAARASPVGSAGARGGAGRGRRLRLGDPVLDPRVRRLARPRGLGQPGPDRPGAGDRIRVGTRAVPARGRARGPLPGAAPRDRRATGPPVPRACGHCRRVLPVRGGRRARARLERLPPTACPTPWSHPPRGLKRRRHPLASNASASLWDVDDGVLCLEFTSKMNAIDPDDPRAGRVGRRRSAIAVTARSCCTTRRRTSPSAPTSRTSSCSRTRPTGSGWRHSAAAAKTPSPASSAHPSPWWARRAGGLSEAAARCCCTATRSRRTPRPPWGSSRQASASSPGGAGARSCSCASSSGSRAGRLRPCSATFELIGLGRVSGSAAEARELGFLRPRDRITANRDRLLADAKTFALELADGYAPPEPRELRLPGPSGAAALALAMHDRASAGLARPHDLAWPQRSHAC